MEQQKTPEIISVRVRKKAVQHKASFISNGSNTQLKSQGYRNHLKIGRKKCREEKTTYNLRWIEPRKNMYTIVARFFASKLLCLSHQYRDFNVIVYSLHIQCAQIQYC